MVLCAGIIFGAVAISPQDFIETLKVAFDSNVTSMQKTLVVDIRMPRVILALFVGGALAVSGAIYQALFHNPLADPYILGISSGAGLGAMIAFITAPLLGIARLGIVPLFAGLGATLTVILVVQLGFRRGRMDLLSILLAGVAISYTLAAITSFIMVFAREQMSAIVYWNTGALTRANWPYVLTVGPLILLIVIATAFFAREFDVILLGSERAKHLGVNAKRFTYIALGLATALTALAVSVSGLIGFVGLMVPHMIRLRYGSAHKHLIPLSFLGGAILLIGADIIARTILAPIELPVGIITAVLGGPFFVWLLRKERGRG